MESHTTNAANEHIKYEDPNLPNGWKRDVKERPGKNKTKHEVNIISPEGKVFKNPLQLEKHLKSMDSDLKSSDFDFSLTGKSYRKKRKSGEAELSDNTENEPRRRSGRIQMKLRSQEGDQSAEEIEHVELKSPKKSTPHKKMKNKDLNENLIVSTAEALDLKKGEVIEMTQVTQTEQTTVVTKDNEGNIEEIVSKTVVTENSDIDLLSNETDKSLQVLDSYDKQNNIDARINDETDTISQPSQLPEIQVEKTTITTSFVEKLETKDKDLISDLTNSNGITKDVNNQSHIKENGEHEAISSSHSHKQDVAMHTNDKDNAESPIYSIKHSILTSQTTTTIETSTN